MLGLSFGPFTSSAQEHPYNLLKKLRKANDTKVISYDYNVHLVNTIDGKISDSIIGKVYKNHIDYFDSNSATIIVMQDGYYLNINKLQKSAMVFDVELVRKKLGINKEDLSNEIISLPDSMILKYGKIKNEKLANGDYKFIISFKELSYTSIQLIIDKNTMIAKDIIIESNDGEPATTSSGNKRKYHIYNIKHSIPSNSIDIGRYFTVTNNKVILNKKYSDYQTNTITK